MKTLTLLLATLIVAITPGCSKNSTPADTSGANSNAPAQAASAAASLQPGSPAPVNAQAGNSASPDASQASSQAHGSNPSSDKDAALTTQLSGMWTTRVESIHSYMGLGDGHEMIMNIVPTTGTDKKVVWKGTWTVEGGKLIQNITQTSDGNANQLGTYTSEISSVSDKTLELTVRSGDKVHTYLYTKVPMQDAISSLTSPSNPSPSTQTQAAEDAAPQANAQDRPSAGNSGNAIEPFMEESRYVATNNLDKIMFDINKPAQVKLVVDIDDRVPIDVVVLPLKATYAQYTNLVFNIGMQEGAEALATFAALLGDNTNYKTDTRNRITEADLFNLPLSKKGAYVHYESDWTELKPGSYTVFLDNMGNFTPTRGDAPVKLAVYAVADQ